MRKLKSGIISLDISSVSTGWAYFVKDKLKAFGTIKIKSSLDKSKKLSIFRVALEKLLKKYPSENVVIENGFSGRNVSTLKTLSHFSGVAQECVRTTLDIEPYIMNNKVVKAYFEVVTKEELFEVIKNIFNFKDFNFKEHNDVCDAIAQAVCYYNNVLKENKSGI
jgi:Holliday junction resolvasome RuvABC endonuclease subunit